MQLQRHCPPLSQAVAQRFSRNSLQFLQLIAILATIVNHELWAVANSRASSIVQFLRPFTTTYDRCEPALSRGSRFEVYFQVWFSYNRNGRATIARSSESLIVFIHVETTLRGGPGIKLTTLTLHAIARKVFKMFQLNMSMIVELIVLTSSQTKAFLQTGCHERFQVRG